LFRFAAKAEKLRKLGLSTAKKLLGNAVQVKLALFGRRDLGLLLPAQRA